MLEHLCACGLLLHSDGSRGCSKNEPVTLGVGRSLLVE